MNDIIKLIYDLREKTKDGVHKLNTYCDVTYEEGYQDAISDVIQYLNSNRPSKFLVVHESEYYNKYSQIVPLGKIGTAVQTIYEELEIPFEQDVIDRYNSDNPYEVGTFGKGFYDINMYKGKGEQEEYCGRIMIFDISEE